MANKDIKDFTAHTPTAATKLIGQDTGGSGGSFPVSALQAIPFAAAAAFASEVANTDGDADDSITIDWQVSNKQKVTLDGNKTLVFTNPPGACSLLLKVVQDATGSRLITWPAGIKWPAGTAPTLSTGADKIDIVTFYFDGTTYHGSAGLDFRIVT